MSAPSDGIIDGMDQAKFCVPRRRDGIRMDLRAIQTHANALYTFASREIDNMAEGVADDDAWELCLDSVDSVQQHGAEISAAIIDEACQDIPVDEAIRDIIAQSVRSMDGVETFAELGSVPAEVEKHTACEHCNGDTNTIKRGANGVSRWLYCKQCTRTVFLRRRSDVAEMWAYLMAILWWHGDRIGAKMLRQIPYAP